MEEKNELNDIILNKSGSGSSTKKLLLAIAALTLILIIVLVIMNSLKSESDESAPAAASVPEPSSPTEVIDDPLFEPVEVIQEGSNESNTQDLGEIAQKIKQESFQNTPVVETTVPAIPTPAPVSQAKPAVQTAPAIATPKVQTQVPPQPKPIVQTVPAKPQTVSKPTQNVVNTPTIKTTKPTETKSASTQIDKPAALPVKTATTPVTRSTTTAEKPTSVPSVSKPAAPKTVEKALDTTGTYYIQVGSFSKEPDKKLFDRLNASGLKYTTSPNGSMTKVMVGPFQGEKAARDVLGTVKRNVESGAYITKG